MIECLSCGLNGHNTLSKSFPKTKWEVVLNKITAIKNLPYNEARQKYSSNYFESLHDNLYADNFPSLTTSSTVSAKNDNDK